MRILALIFCVSLIVSCKKEGCIDALATNYNAEAKTNDGTCTFESQVSFWFNQNISNLLVNSYNVTTLHVFVNDENIGEINANDWSVGPDCGGANFTKTLNLGGSASTSMTYTVNDQNGVERFDGSFQAEANDCESIQLKY